jgi:hypothetical protein
VDSGVRWWERHSFVGHASPRFGPPPQKNSRLPVSFSDQLSMAYLIALIAAKLPGFWV